jgi:hypothetical protein
MVHRAQHNRIKQAEEVSYQRDFLADQHKLKKKMRNMIISTIEQETEKVEYLENWVFIIYFMDTLQALRDHVANRRQRIDDITRVRS